MRAFYKYKNWKKTNIRGAVWSVELKASTLQGGVKKSFLQISFHAVCNDVNKVGLQWTSIGLARMTQHKSIRNLYEVHPSAH